MNWWPSNLGPLIAKNNSPVFNVRESIEYPRTLILPGPSRVPATALLISSSVKFMQQFFRYRPIVERMHGCSNRLIRFVSLAGDENRIAFSRLRERKANRFSTVGLHPIRRAFHAFFDFLDDRQRIFASWIVRRDNRVIAFTSSNCTHQRPLRAIAFTSAAEYDNHPAGSNFTRGFQNFLKSIIGMRVVDDHAEGLAGVDGFEPPRYM